MFEDFKYNKPKDQKHCIDGASVCPYCGTYMGSSWMPISHACRMKHLNDKLATKRNRKKRRI